MKKNGVDIRLCIDYRGVNLLIKLSSYPLPLIDELLDNFESVMWFLSLDMASGFWGNAPLIYQRVIDNCHWGLVRLPLRLENDVDPGVLEFFGTDPAPLGLQRSAEWFRRVNASAQTVKLEQLTCAPELEGKMVFELNIPAPKSMGSVLRRSSYIDDIAYSAEDWEDLASFDKQSIPYLSHEIDRIGIQARPKILAELVGLPSPKTLKGVQSFLGSLNFYNKFIEGFPVLASALYELTDAWIKPFVVILHANPWAISAQEILALLRVLTTFYTLVVGQTLKVKRPLLSIEMLPEDFKGRITTFDGAAKLKSEAGNFNTSADYLASKALQLGVDFVVDNDDELAHRLGRIADQFVLDQHDASGVRRTFERAKREFYWIDLFADVERYVAEFAMAGTNALEVAQAYEEVVFRRFGASSFIRHDQDPRFMSDVFREFRNMTGSRQRATLAYRPQANGQQERSVQTVAWRDLADKYMAGFQVGDAVWLYMARVQPGLFRKLAHLWHGPFRTLEASEDFRYLLKTAGTPYRVDEEFDLDSALLPEDCFQPDNKPGEYEVEAILDSRLSCGALLYAFDTSAMDMAKFAAMQSSDDRPD
ncbi:hypothetical protein PybrP1_011015 [[Pythium] brassicae (nom. inval.)]|nr:hypothetical protein PybrP1_011015 [[Pythium] brassicae (nom. inval.)]